MNLVDALVHALRRPAGRHCLERPRPGQLPAAQFDPDDAYHELDDGLPADELLPEDVLAPYLVALNRDPLPHPRLTAPEFSRRTEWPYTLGSV